MDKKQFVEHMIEQVRSLSISAVVGSRVLLKLQAGHHKGLCPFHNDNRIGSFIVTERKHMYKCFSCGAGGDTVNFIAEHDGINYLESAFKLALEYGIISNSDYDEYYTRRRYKADDVNKIKKRYELLDKSKMENNIASKDILDKVFRILIGISSLSDEHENYLTSDRGLSKEEIEKGLYFTFPTRRKMPSILLKLRSEFPEGSDILEGIPGFFFDKKENSWTFTFNAGIGIGIQNAQGQVVGIQVRHDQKKEAFSSRYVWFSSSFAMYDEEKFEGGTSSGSPIDVVYPDELLSNTVFITEGRFKAQQIAKEKGAISISVQGVTTWKGILVELDAIKFSKQAKEWAKKKNRPFSVHTVLVAFDADMNYNHAVFTQLQNMTNQLEKNGYPIYYLNWNEQFGKGIDDVLLSKNGSAIKRYDKKTWDEGYEKMIALLIQNEPYDDMKDVPTDVLKKYFYQEMTSIIDNPMERNQLATRHLKANGL